MNKESLKNKKVLVTGSSGVIGRELLKYLISEGANILSVDKLPLPEGSWDKINHIQKNLAFDNLDELLDFNPEIIFHLAAAFERSKESADFWDVNWEDNILASHNTIDISKNMSNLKTFVFASSYLLYDTDLYMSENKKDVKFLNENDIVKTRNLCGGAKLYAENELKFIKELYMPDLRVVNARIYRVYGRGSKDIISRWVKMSLKKEKLEVYNKENNFDYVFAGDVAKGLLKLVQSPEAEGVINLATGKPNPVENILKCLIKENILDEYDIIDFGNTEEFESSCADISKLKDMTGWKPENDLKSGIKKIIDYESKN